MKQMNRIGLTREEMVEMLEKSYGERTAKNEKQTKKVLSIGAQDLPHGRHSAQGAKGTTEGTTFCQFIGTLRCVGSL